MKNKICGLWKLVSFENRNSQGNISYPLGTNPLGYIVYLDNGYMSAHLSKSYRKSVDAKLPQLALANEQTEMLASYFSYCGHYEIKGEEVLHHVELCIFPNQVGTTFTRHMYLDNNCLELSSTMMTPEGEQTFVALWRKEG